MQKSQPDPRAAIPDEYKPADWLIKCPNRPPSAKVGINHPSIIHAGVGVVLSAWEQLETILAWEFQRLIGTKEISALRAWGSIASNKARVDAIMAAANVVLKGDELKHHRRCMDDVKHLSSVRNLVAHGMVYFDDNGTWVSVDMRTSLRNDGAYALGPAYYSTTKMRDGSFYIFSQRELDSITAEIQKMQSRVSALRNGEYHRYFRFQMK